MPVNRLSGRISCVLLGIGLIFLAGCGNRIDDSIAKVHKGMREDQVLEIMGLPQKARAGYDAITMGPMVPKVLIYRGANKWHRVVVLGTVLFVDSATDDSEDPQFPISLEITKTRPSEYQYKVGGPLR